MDTRASSRAAGTTGSRLPSESSHCPPFVTACRDKSGKQTAILVQKLDLCTDTVAIVCMLINTY